MSKMRICIQNDELYPWFGKIQTLIDPNLNGCLPLFQPGTIGAVANLVDALALDKSPTMVSGGVPHRDEKWTLNDSCPCPLAATRNKLRPFRIPTVNTWILCSNRATNSNAASCKSEPNMAELAKTEVDPPFSVLNQLVVVILTHRALVLPVHITWRICGSDAVAAAPGSAKSHAAPVTAVPSVHLQTFRRHWLLSMR